MRDRKILLVVIAVVAIAAIGFFVYRRSTQKKQATAQRDQAQAAARAIPVVAGQQARKIALRGPVPTAVS